MATDSSITAANTDSSLHVSPRDGVPGVGEAKANPTSRSLPTGGRYLTVGEVAEIYRCGQDKVLAWINGNELEAIDVSSVDSKRPQWRIRPDALARFEGSRSSISRDDRTACRMRSQPARKRPQTSERNWLPHVE